MGECYYEDDVIKYSILEFIEALEAAIDERDEEVREFYKNQYSKAKELIRG